MAYSTFTLPCGLRILHRPSPTPVVYCGFVVDCGTRDELPQESGMAHYLEHLLFKGTRHRRAWHILNRMEAVGGDLNAFTQKEETVIYAAFMSEHFQRAAELLTDIVFQSTFPQREMDHEVEVVCDEIDSYQDTPSEQIFDDFEDLIFHGHPLGRNILGSPHSLRTYRTDDVARFYQRYYQPQNMVFFLHGSIPFQQVVSVMDRLLGRLQFPQWSREQRTSPPPYRAQRQKEQRGTHQAHVMLGTRTYPAGNPHRTPLYLLNNMLGGPGMNSRLNLSLRERRGLVYTVESNLSSYTDTGVFSIYYGCDAHDVDHCLHLCQKELEQFMEHPLTPQQLRAAQKQIKGQIGVSLDNFENTMIDTAKAYLHYGVVETIDDIFQRIDALTPEVIQETARELFQEDGLSLLEYV
ncbi:MAG: insulinase family protein [Bacteroidaceae bacterium]|jgi:predicted Zn-dependent peptidase|nr:insulinase family protein [Bacteroidaceae bacterium]